MEKVVLEFDVDSKGAVTSVNKVNDALEDTGKTGKKELNTLQKGITSVGKAGKKVASGGLKAISTGFKGIGNKVSIVANCANIPHDPDEVDRKEIQEVDYKW